MGTLLLDNSSLAARLSATERAMAMLMEACIKGMQEHAEELGL